jgi:hypothetical protein
MQRAEFTVDGIDLIRDDCGGATCLMWRSSNINSSVHLDGDFKLLRCATGGWLLQSKRRDLPSYWFPALVMLRQHNAQAHILRERPAYLDTFDLDTEGVTLSFAEIPPGWTLDAVIWKLSDPELASELLAVRPDETQGRFLLGSHTRYDRPADLYRHLIHGKIYEDRYAWPHKRRVCSENDAHALHLIFSGLQHTTGKRIYAMLKAQIVLSVLARQSADGGFRHGEWTEHMESHYRLHCSALHLLMDALAEHDDPIIRTALARGVTFISDKYDATTAGAWFYHDELETSEAGMRGAPFKWWPGTALGKSPQNMLVLNTQLDTLVALRRYGEISGDTQYAALVESGYQAALALLALRPMEWLYRLVFSAIDLTLMPTERAMRLPLWQRLWKRIGWQLFIPRLPRLKTRFPRLVMPGGYIDRELSLQTWAYDYLAVNLMDMVRMARGSHRDALQPYLHGILDFCTRTGIARRWLEHPARAYALGFHAEALTLLSRAEPRAETDALLAEALTLCARHGLGLPPSLDGGNSEARLSGCAVARATVPGIVVANLSRGEHAAALVVNVGLVPLLLGASLEAIPAGWVVPTHPLMPDGWIRLTA